MPLRITLHINADEIGDYEVRNVGETWPGEARYEIRHTRAHDVIGSVHHYRAQGAESLAAKALDAIGRHVRRQERET